MNRNTSHPQEGCSLAKTLKKLWKNEYFETAVIIGLTALIVVGFWFGSQAVLNTPYPALAVVSGSMCIPYDSQCDGWTHPFTRTLHVGDLIIVQGVNASDLNTDYRNNSDIIVFHKPTNFNELIVHRIVATENDSGEIVYRTKGDGNGINKWPDPVQSSEYDPWKIHSYEIVGKVVMRIPWLGHVVLFMRNALGLPLVIALIMILVVVEFVLPLLRKKTRPEKPKPAPMS